MKMKETHFRSRVLTPWVVFFSLIFSSVESQTTPTTDASVMFALKESLKSSTVDLGWTDPDPCKWKNIGCNGGGNQVTRIQLKDQRLTGTLPPTLQKLSALETLELQGNQISGDLPSLSGLSSLQHLILSGNNFSSIPSDFFHGLGMLGSIFLDDIPFKPWEIPVSLVDATSLQIFSANSANIIGKIPGFLSDTFASLAELHLAFNSLDGGLPANLSNLPSINSLWLNGQKTKLTGDISVIQNMTSLKKVWLHSNAFTGPLPDFSDLTNLEDLSLRDNMFTGPVPPSLVSLDSLRVLNLTNNYLQGPMPNFTSPVSVDMTPTSNSFCLPTPGNCDPRVNTLLSIVRSFGYPLKLAEDWKGNDPCSSSSWLGISCNNGNIIVINFRKMNLTGTIPAELSALPTLERIVLADNSLTGPIPSELTKLPGLKLLDVTNNQISGKVPSFRSNVIVNTQGNKDMGKDIILPPPSSPGSPVSPGGNSSGSGKEDKKKSSVSVGAIVGAVIGCLLGIALIGLICCCWYKRNQKQFGRVQSPNTMVIHPRHSGSDPETLKITVAGSSVNVGTSDSYSLASSGPSDNHMVEAGNMVISIQVLRNVTNNFSQDNILGRGGFGTVYKGELDDGTRIAVKRMESGVMTGKGLTEFKSEIAVLTKVRHRHLVALLGYCLDGNERLLVYEYMPQGTLSEHLFHWKDLGLKPLEWTRRLSIALDVARGVEYLHGLAQQSFIHRDLKPSNILLGDDMRAKVADFGLVRHAPDGKGSVETKLAGTFGYLAPEYAATGRVTTKVDVYSFGVILMELITGRKALDESQPEDSMHLVTWFRRMHLNKETFHKAIDTTIDLTEETLVTVRTVAELAGHCCAREPYQRPDMGHTVNVLSSLVELWKPSDPDAEDIYGIDLDMTLPQALKKWQAFEGTSQMDATSSFLASVDNTQTSIPTRPSGFADSFTSADGR